MYLFSSDASEVSLTQKVLGKKLSLNFFHENRAKALDGIRVIVEDVCVKELGDLMNLAIKRNTERELLKTQMVMSPPSVAEPMNPMISRFGGLRLSGESSRSVVPPMDPMQQRFGGLRFTGESSQSVVPPMDPKIQRFGGLGLTGESFESVMPPLLVDEPKEMRKMFATFSKGHPVFKWELWGYFNRMYGDCVESISMQEVKPNEQSLFAVIVFTSSAIVGLVLRGLEKAKFTIKGKHVWMRKFIPKA